MEYLKSIVRKSKRANELIKCLEKLGSTVHLEQMVGGAYSLYAAAIVEKMEGIHIFVADDRDSAAYLVNDLYELLRDVPEEYYSDMTHLYTPEATKLIGTQVLRHICDAADIPFRVLEDGYEFRNDDVIGI